MTDEQQRAALPSAHSEGGKRQVAVRIESVTEDQRIVQETIGDLYPKGEHVYLRYQEPQDDLGNTVTTVRVDAKEVRIMRQGDVRSEQTFTLGAKRTGRYDTPQGRLELETVTDALEVSPQLAKGSGTVAWSYELLVMGSSAGRYALCITVEAR